MSDNSKLIQAIDQAQAAIAVAQDHFDVNAKPISVSRNDAAMLEASRAFWTKRRELVVAFRSIAVEAGLRYLVNSSAAALANQAVEDHIEKFTPIAAAWLDGKDVVLAKLAQQ